MASFGNRVFAAVISYDEVILEWNRFLIQDDWCPYKNRMPYDS